MEQESRKKVLIIAGPTGSGETTITNELISRYPDTFTRLVTATTRTPRLNEEHGKDYYFFTEEEFKSYKAKGDIIEDTYVPNRDTYYGTYKPDLEQKLKEGYVVIGNLDVVGARFYKKHHDATTIFIMPRDMVEISNRLQKRDPDIPKELLEKRLKNAEQEIKEEQPFYDYTVENADGTLPKTMDDIENILKKEGYISK